MHAFLAKELVILQDMLEKSFVNNTPLTALSALNQLASIVLVIQAEVSNSDVQALLNARVEVAMQLALAVPKGPLSQFWQNEMKLKAAFIQRYLKQKIAAADAKEAALLTLLQKKIAPQTFSADQAANDAEYWKILSQPENKTFKDLAVELHEASEIDYTLLTKTIKALIDRLTVQKHEAAKALLVSMLSTKSDILLFQASIEAWFYVAPLDALSFMFGLCRDEINTLYANPTFDSFTARTDYHLIMRLISLSLKNDALMTVVYNDLLKKVFWFTAKDKKDLDFFTMSLELNWFKQQLTAKTEHLEEITNAVDFGVDFQKKTMSLLRFSQQSNFQVQLDLLSQMQQQLIQQVNSGLNSLATKGPKIKQVLSIIADAHRHVQLQNKELASMQAVQNDLEEASRILHSIQSQSQSESQASKSSSSTSNTSQEMQKKTLKLAPELSIRLLQEMEQDDKSLKTQNIPQVSGKRPW